MELVFGGSNPPSLAKKGEDMIEDIKRYYSYYLDKYEVACVFREHDKALQYQGVLLGLEQLLLKNKETEWPYEQKKKLDDRKKKLVDLYRELIKE